MLPVLVAIIPLSRDVLRRLLHADPAMTRSALNVGARLSPLEGHRRHLVLIVRLVAGASIAAVALATPGFTSPLSINALLNAISFIGCVAVGMTFITITGNIMSLCLGATVSASALIFLASFPSGWPGGLRSALLNS